MFPNYCEKGADQPVFDNMLHMPTVFFRPKLWLYQVGRPQESFWIPKWHVKCQASSLDDVGPCLIVSSLAAWAARHHNADVSTPETICGIWLPTFLSSLGQFDPGNDVDLGIHQSFYGSCWTQPGTSPQYFMPYWKLSSRTGSERVEGPEMELLRPCAPSKVGKNWTTPVCMLTVVFSVMLNPAFFTFDDLVSILCSNSLSTSNLKFLRPIQKLNRQHKKTPRNT